MNTDELLNPTGEPEFTEHDDRLRPLTREQALLLTPELRMRWFFLLQVMHSELERVSDDLHELLEPNNEVKIVSIVGMTGIGKTTLATNLIHSLHARFDADAEPHHVPLIYVRARANGERSLSWTVLYKLILDAGAEVLIERKRSTKVEDGELKASRKSAKGLAQLREHLELMLKQRNVRVLVIDEAFHLMRFEEYTAIMDTLKSLADIHDTKLLLIGNYDIASLMIEYGQVARRSEIIHYRRYACSPEVPGKLTPDQAEFKAQIQKFQDNWPCAEVPNLQAVWHSLMNASLGSMGLLKGLLLRLASLQMKANRERVTSAILRKASKCPKALQKIEAETVEGESRLLGSCYGDSAFGDEEALKQLLVRMQEPIHA